MNYCDRNLKPLTLLEWARKFEDTEYRRIGRTVLDNSLVVSTVWIGICSEPCPQIFETMVFYNGDEKDIARYTSEAKARIGHQSMIIKWRDWGPPRLPIYEREPHNIIP